jgi:hypothetical protein
VRIKGADIAGADIPQLVSERGEKIGELLDAVRVEQDRPMIADALSLWAHDTCELVISALGNDVGGANVIPHLIASLDALIGELEKLR